MPKRYLQTHTHKLPPESTFIRSRINITSSLRAISSCLNVYFWTNTVRSVLVCLACWLSQEARFLEDSDKMQHISFVMGVTMALLECPPPWNSMVPKASVGLSCVCLLIDHFSDKLSFLASRSALSFWLDEMPGGRPTCWPMRRPQQHLDDRSKSEYITQSFTCKNNNLAKQRIYSIKKEKWGGACESLREAETERERCHRCVPRSKRGARLKWQIFIWPSSWLGWRKKSHNPLQYCIGSFYFLLSTNFYRTSLLLSTSSFQ